MNERYLTYSQIWINKKKAYLFERYQHVLLGIVKAHGLRFARKSGTVICRYTWYDIYREITRIHRRRLRHASARIYWSTLPMKKDPDMCRFRSDRHSFNNTILKDCMYLRQSIARGIDLPGQFDDEVEL